MNLTDSVTMSPPDGPLNPELVVEAPESASVLPAKRQERKTPAAKRRLAADSVTISPPDKPLIPELVVEAPKSVSVLYRRRHRVNRRGKKTPAKNRSAAASRSARRNRRGAAAGTS